MLTELGARLPRSFQINEGPKSRRYFRFTRNLRGRSNRALRAWKAPEAWTTAFSTDVPLVPRSFTIAPTPVVHSTSTCEPSIRN